VPAGEPLLLSREWFDPWVAAYLASDAGSAGRSPSCVRVPAGPVRDILAAAGGKLPYGPQEVTVPTLIVRGEWDSWPTDADAQWLMDALTNAPVKRDVKLPRGTHVMHLESNRLALFAEVEKFLD
jgi:pimeloyl-ACP methyl ester carboxylesterase